MGAKKLRKLIVNTKEFLWKCNFSRGEVCKSTLTIYLTKEAKIIIMFFARDTFTCGNPFNEGFPMLKNNEVVQINLNCPKYAAELIDYLDKSQLLEVRNSKIVFDGNDLLKKMGYIDVEKWLITNVLLFDSVTN